jgi:putative flippase GtrA
MMGGISFNKWLYEQLQRKGIRQFVKFCIVGSSSTIIDFSIANVAYYLLGVRPAALASVMGFCVAVVNGYFWNSRWTFRDRVKRAVHDEFIRFFTVNVVGAALNYSIVSLVLLFDPNDPHPKWVFNGAKMLATGIVVFWNFFANRHWTFGRRGVVKTSGTAQASDDCPAS